MIRTVLQKIKKVQFLGPFCGADGNRHILQVFLLGLDYLFIRSGCRVFLPVIR